MLVLYTFSCNISHMLLSSGFKSGEVGGHSLGGIHYEFLSVTTQWLHVSGEHFKFHMVM